MELDPGVREKVRPVGPLVSGNIGSLALVRNEWHLLGVSTSRLDGTGAI